MNLEEALFAYLKDHAGLKALVGTRIYPLILPQPPTLPAVTYFKVSLVNRRVMASPSDVLKQVRVQFSCWANTYSETKSVAEQVKVALQDFAGQMGGGVQVLDGNIINEQDLYEDDTGIYHVPVDVLIMHE